MEGLNIKNENMKGGGYPFNNLYFWHQITFK